MFSILFMSIISIIQTFENRIILILSVLVMFVMVYVFECMYYALTFVLHVLLIMYGDPEVRRRSVSCFGVIIIIIVIIIIDII